MTDTKIVVDCTTGETQVVTLTAEEIAQREADAQAFAAAEAERLAAEEAKAQAKASAEAKLAALGLTADEIAALAKSLSLTSDIFPIRRDIDDHIDIAEILVFKEQHG